MEDTGISDYIFKFLGFRKNILVRQIHVGGIPNFLAKSEKKFLGKVLNLACLP
jgi:hypothetical protein